jgi:hypothetical protein
MARPVVSVAAEEMFAALGPWADADGEDTGWALLKFCEAVAAPLQAGIDNARDQADGTPGWAKVMSADTAPIEWLPWLGQFVGIKVDTYMPDAEQREQIKAEQSWQRGTTAYFIAQVRKWLVGTQTVEISERDTSPYHFSVNVYGGELSGLHYSTLDAMYLTYAAMDAAYASYADMTSTSEQNLIDAAQAAKPAGLVMALTITPGSP